jgi:exosortase
VSSQPPIPSIAKRAPEAPVQVDIGSIHPTRSDSPRSALFTFLVVVSLLIFWTPLRVLFHYPIWTDYAYDKYCYPVVVPFLSLAVVFLERRNIFPSARYGLRAGMPLLLAGVFLRFIAAQVSGQIGAGNYLSIELLGLVAFWIGGFILCYGMSAFRAGAFPLLLLLLTVPIPDFLLDKLIVAVQHGSTEVCSLIFGLFRVPVLRDGLTFTLPEISIRVEKECSGIHSTMAIVLVSLIVAHLFLASKWKKVLLVSLSIPIVCVTNGLRIAILTLLAEYVDRSFLFGSLHHQGGVIFFALAFLLVYVTMLFLSPKTPGISSTAASSAPKPEDSVS